MLPVGRADSRWERFAPIGYGQAIGERREGARVCRHWCFIAHCELYELRGARRETLAQVADRLLFDEGQDVVHPAARLVLVVSPVWFTLPGTSPAARGKVAMHIVVIQETEADLLEVV